MSLTFISHADAEKFSSSFGPKVLELENPLSEEASVMRTSLVPGMLDMLAWNLNRDVTNARLFEMAGVYEMSSDGERVEPSRACLGATAAAVRAALPASGALDVSKGEHAAAAEAFRGFKGDVENLLALFAGEIRYDSGTAEYFHPGRSARALVKGACGRAVRPDSPGSRCGAKAATRRIYRLRSILINCTSSGCGSVKFSPLGKYPAVERDFSFVFPTMSSSEPCKKAVKPRSWNNL